MFHLSAQTCISAEIEKKLNMKAHRHLWKTVAVKVGFFCMLLFLTVVSLKVVVLFHAYFIGCRWYLLSIYVCLFESTIPSTHSTSCQGWSILQWHCRVQRIVILLFVCVM